MKSYVCITGGAGGLGKAFAVECASRGYDIFLTDTREDALSTIAEGIRNTYGTKVLYEVCDLTDADSRTRLFTAIEQKGYQFWSLINVAGVDFEGTFFEKSREEIRTILRLNIEANLEMTHEILRFRNKGRTFRLINVASMAAYYPIPIKATYAASKRFLLNFSLAIREELKAYGGTVTTLCPGGMPTNALVIKCIDAQGFMGRVTTNNVGFVAANTLDRALKGKAVYIPGAANRLLRLLGRLVPQTFIARSLAARWRSAFKKSHGVPAT
ncbi:MAG: SDR family NAD(P)-dependent oxidoreductase [Clostridia bacterium]|nr:SDR family NAD(P)-dependent oxidoreductase [Clostridia bacterium]